MSARRGGLSGVRDEARRRAEKARKEAEEKARRAAERAKAAAEEAAGEALDRLLTEAAREKIEEHRPLVDRMSEASDTLHEREQQILDEVVLPIWNGEVSGEKAVALLLDLYSAPTLQAVSREAEIRHFLTLSVGFAGSAAYFLGGGGVFGVAGGVGVGLVPPRANASLALFGSLGAIGGASIGGDVGLQIGVWLREPQALGQNIDEALVPRIIQDGAQQAFRDTLAGFDLQGPWVPGAYWGAEVSAAFKGHIGGGAYFDWGRASPVGQVLLQGITVYVGVGVEASVNVAVGKVVTHEIGKVGAA